MFSVRLILMTSKQLKGIHIPTVDEEFDFFCKIWEPEKVEVPDKVVKKTPDVVQSADDETAKGK
jgi:hypothetical protein